jgi:lipopolysaccharide transport system ATP-binding protein
MIHLSFSGVRHPGERGERPVVVFDGVWKKFRRGERCDSLRDLLPSLARSTFRRARRDLEPDGEFWALRDVSFEVKPGEALGIIGPNGAGKSTTLKLLTRILRPTRGACHVRGRVGALIEVAAGFHPDLTGRENIYLQGAIMGLDRATVRARLDEIIEFAGVSAFVDTPVKRYSSGMNARLGFAIAAFLQPDVMLVDEVLAVGDMAFQRKCVERMRTFRDNGAAIVLVSHDLATIARLCQRAVLLERGAIVTSGAVSNVVSTYVQRFCTTEQQASGGAATIAVDDCRPLERARVAPGDCLSLTVTTTFHQPVNAAQIGLVVWDVARNAYVYGASSSTLGLEPVRAQAGDAITHTFEFNANLARGSYAVELNVFEGPVRLVTLMPAVLFTVVEQVTFDGVANLFLRGHRKTEALLVAL